MSSSLTFQLRQQQQQDEHKLQQHPNDTMALTPSSNDGLPSPPNSSYGDEAAAAQNDLAHGGVAIKEPPQERRDSLPTHFNALTLQNHSTSLPENYTIEHSSAPIPITSSNNSHSHHPGRRVSANESRQIARSSSGSPSPMLYLGSPTATAAATGGRTIRNNARLNSNNPHTASSSLPVYTSHPQQHSTSTSTSTTTAAAAAATIPTTAVVGAPPGKKGAAKALHRCEDCGKVYKHYNCLAKHRWEHSEEWELTSKLLLTKHQQVQMLEAAAILVSLDTRRVEQEQQKMREQQEVQKRLQMQHTSEDDDDIDDDESIHITDNDDDDDIIVDMEMDDVPPPPTHPSCSPASSSTTISIASPSITTTTNHSNSTPSSQPMLSNGHA